MGMRWWRAGSCDRASQWISLELDGELSQLEQAALGRHLTACARCRAVSADVRAFTRAIRDAPLIELDRPVALAPDRRPRVSPRRIAASMAFAGLSAAAVLGGLVVTSGGVSSGSALAFRNAKEQQRFAHLETRRLEPAVFVVVKPTVPSFAPRVLV